MATQPAHPAHAAVRTWQMLFTPQVRSVRLVRAQVGKALAGWGLAGDGCDTVVLICSELATNCVEHARVKGRLFQVRLTVRDGGDCLIEVSDASPVVPCPLQPGPEDERGAGCNWWPRSPRVTATATVRRSARRSGRASRCPTSTFRR